MGTILDRIVETKRGEVAERRRLSPLAALRSEIAAVSPARDFYAAVTQPTDGIRLIAEIKKASPSAGLIREDFDPVAMARLYEAAGASALSVLTDGPYFQGDLSYVAAAKDAVSLPVLRKDFIIDAYQIHESRAAGADAVLLIAAVLTPEQVDAWSRQAAELGMSSLIEVHDAAELEAVRPFAEPSRRAILGINNRDLHKQVTDLNTTRRLAALVDNGRPYVTESGIKTRQDVVLAIDCGAMAMLVGETLMREADPAAKIRELLENQAGLQ